MKKKEFWRGVEGIELLWHGEWGDPQLRYGNVVANIVDVEECLSSSFEETMGIEDTWDGEHEEEFSQYCRDNREEVIECIYSGQTVQNRFQLMHSMMDEIGDKQSEEMYDMFGEVALNGTEELFKEKKMDEWLEERIREFNKLYGLEGLGESWWKYDYADYHSEHKFKLANIHSLWDLARWFYKEIR